jgi:hypothetical protein
MNAMLYHDLEIMLSPDAKFYRVDVRASQPGSDADTRFGARLPDGSLNIGELKRLALEQEFERYGEELASGLLRCPELRQALGEAQAVAQAENAALRIRLFIDCRASELHELYWETLRESVTELPLLMSERLVFSRYLNSSDWTPVKQRALRDLRALLVVANPNDLAGWKPDGRELAPIDVKGELRRARMALHNIAADALSDVTLENIFARLREGYDVIYLVCHGSLGPDGKPLLWLMNETGAARPVNGEDFVSGLKLLQKRPSLIVLASCQSAGSDEASSADKGVLAALGPKLAAAGIPAVIAMQGNITMQTSAAFMQKFFAELCVDGQIDRAVAVARGEVRGRPDWWIPVLFMRLKSGRLWYKPSFDEKFQRWDALLISIKKGACTPILGTGICESALGSLSGLAERLAEEHSFPLAVHSRDDLTQVSQYLAAVQDRFFLETKVFENLRRSIEAGFGVDIFPEGALGDPSWDDNLWHRIYTARAAKDPKEPHGVLARLPLPVYVTANHNGLLTAALRAHGKEPRVGIAPWNADEKILVEQIQPDFLPTAQKPLVYHLFGQYGDPESLVLTEDDYFKWLIGITRNWKYVPERVRSVLVNTALLFIGFQLEDWSFRVLLQILKAQEGSMLRKKQTHVGVQIEPIEGRVSDPRGARVFLDSYFRGAQIDIFWGSAEDFVSHKLFFEVQKLAPQPAAANGSK